MEEGFDKLNQRSELLHEVSTPHDGRLKKVMDAIRVEATPEEINQATHIDPWFVDQLFLISEVADEVIAADELTPPLLRHAKRHGFSDAQIGRMRDMREDVVRGVRHALGVRPVYKTVDTCAAEFAARTPYHYSSYDEETEVAPRDRPAVIILGSGPNRIGQGIEFDYSCVHASLSLHDAGYETVMVNCNPETVSTDYDTSDRLYFEPLALEDVLEIVHAEAQAGPIAGVICQLGGQTPLGLAQGSRTQACTSSGRRRPPSTSPRSGVPSGGCWPRPVCRRPSTAWPPRSRKRSRSPHLWATRCWCDRPPGSRFHAIFVTVAGAHRSRASFRRRPSRCSAPASRRPD